jgi:hypothetical protein
MNQRSKLLIASVILADLVLLLVWLLRDERSVSAPIANAPEAEAQPTELARDPSISRAAAVAEKAPRPGAEAPHASRPTRDAVLAPASIQVRGTVYGLDGRALNGVQVAIRAADSAGKLVETRAGSGAAYYLEDLHAGHWQVTAQADEFHDTRVNLDLSASKPVHALDLELQRLGELRIRWLTPDGGSFHARREAEGSQEEVAAFETHTMPGARLTEMQAQEFGLLRDQLYRPPAAHADAEKGFGSDVEGVLQLREPLPAFISAVLGDVVLQTKRAEADAVSVTFVLAPVQASSVMTSVRLQLVDAATGAPLSEAEASLDAVDAESDGHGVVRFEGILPGIRHLQMYAPNHESITRTAAIQLGAATDLGVFRLDASTSIRGRFCDEDGKDVSMSWSLVPQTDDDPAHPLRRAGTRSTSGTDSSRSISTFVAEDIGRRKYWIRGFGDQKYAAPTLVDTTNGSVKDVVIRVSSGATATLHCKDGESNLIDYAIADGAERPVVEGGGIGGTIVACLGPGSYTVRYRIGDDAPRTKRFEIGSQAIEMELVR